MNNDRIEVTLGPDLGPKVFEDFQEVSAWLANERQFWSPLGKPPAHTPAYELCRPFDKCYDDINQILAEFRSATEQASQAQARVALPQTTPPERAALQKQIDFNHARYVERLQAAFKRHFQELRIIPSASPRAKFLADLAKQEGATTALLARAYFVRAECEYSKPSEMHAALAASYFEHGFTSPIPHEQAALAEMRTQWEKDFQRLHDNLTQETATHQKLNQEAAALLESQRKAGGDLVKAEQAVWTNLHSAYDESLALQKPVRYWTKKAVVHRRLAWVFGIGSAILGAVVFVLLYQLIQITLRPSALPGTPQAALLASNAPVPSSATGSVAGLARLGSQPTTTPPPSALANERTSPDWHPEYWRIAVLLAAGVFSVWVIRIVVRIFLTHLHLLSDAHERATMVLTYLSLLRNKTAIQEADRRYLLQALFRPAATGVVKDDGVPLAWLEALTKLGNK